MKQNDSSPAAEDFTSLYEKSFLGMTKLQPGQLVETQVLSISKDTIFLQLNGKSEGVLPREELTDKQGELTVKIGDALKVYFLKADNGEMLFTTRLTGETAGPDLLEKAYHEKIPVEGVVEKEIKGGFEVKIGDTRAFCPYSQMGDKRSDNAAEYVGKRLTFRIQEYKEKGRNILVSNRVFHEEARQDQLASLKTTLKEGQIIKGAIQSVQDFGAFIDLGGVQALLPVSEIGRARVDDIRAVLSVGQEIEASILKIDWHNERITLSMKSLAADPWEKAVEKYPAGSKHAGRVARVTDFGAFVSLEPGLDGLVHISEFRTEGKYGREGQLSGKSDIPVKVGQTLSVQVLTVDRANRRISLKQATSREEDETSAKYLGNAGDSDTYNPFANLLKKK
ncbi:MAG: S1 RNA-binding domain-containing protein [Spirochaetales bacterium]